jgi:nucleoside-diphosphate-sugar epimerase
MREERPVLVTGATGFIGTYLGRQLLAAGLPVRVLVRRPAALDAALREHVECVAGDVRDSAALSRAIAGTHTVLHLAACARAWSRDRDEFEAVNVRAVDALLTAAARADVERLVHVSTVLTLPPYRAAGVNGAASRPTLYEVTKRAGERLVESYAAQGRHAVIVHPTRVYGPGPLTDANAVSKVVGLYLSGRFRVRLNDGDVLANYVHAADVAAGIRLAAERGRSGAHYLLGGENISFRDFLALVGDLGGGRRRVMALPLPAALAAGHVAEWWGRLGGTAPLTPSWVRVFLEDRRGDIEPARTDLGYAPRPLRTGLLETIAWLAQRRRAAA